MAFTKTLLGKVFISHSSKDKPFVRRLVSRLTKEGFRVWLDEHELRVGDQLAEEISKALASSHVVLVVVSEASIKSRWLRFELNKATERMVQGQCRVIPIVKDMVDLPAEVKGLLYADFTREFRFGIKSVLTALDHEANRRAFERGFWSQMEMLIERVFGAKGFASLGSEYDTKDYNLVYIPVPSEEQDHTSVAYEIISSYVTPARPLSEQWWDEYRAAIEQLSERLFLVISERPVEFAAEKSSTGSPYLLIKNLVTYYHTAKDIYARVVILDLSTVSEEEDRLFVLKQAMNLLIGFAHELFGNRSA